jgi:hypothetical protein
MATSIRAFFTKLVSYWTVNVLAPTGDGSGKTDPAIGTHQVEVGKAFLITATPDPGSKFDHWEVNGAYAGTANPLTVSQ